MLLYNTLRNFKKLLNNEHGYSPKCIGLAKIHSFDRDVIVM